MKKITVDLYTQNKLLDKIFRSDVQKPLTFHFINTYSLGLMYRNYNYRNALLEDSIFLPDGWPVILLAKIRVRKNQNITQLRGTNVMRAILARAHPNACNHYFIGSTPQNLIHLQSHISLNYPQVKITGMYSPPFSEGVEWIQDKSMEFKASKSDFVWIGLGTPKQDILMGEIAKCFPNAKAIFAVGAAFDFLTQNRKEANEKLIAWKLEWLYRLYQEPRRLWRRYSIYIFYFLLASRFVTFKDH